MENIEQIDLHDLVDQLDTVDGKILLTESWPTSSMVLSSPGGFILVGVILIGIQAIWRKQ